MAYRKATLPGLPAPLEARFVFYLRKGVTAIETLVTGIIAVIIGLVVGFAFRKYFVESRISSAEMSAKQILSEAQKAAETAKKEALLSAKDEIFNIRTEAENELKERRSQIQHMEKRLSQKEENLEKKSVEFERKGQSLADKERFLDDKETKLQKLYDEQKIVLERVAGMTAAEAKEVLIKRIEDETKHEAAIMIRDIEANARKEADKKARNIISLAIQRCAADHVAETTVSAVLLPNDEMKGRIIGREGRNIRSFETLTGINLIIDDTPEAVILSSFDPVRREIARRTLERLISDGRIHPARIEEMYTKAKEEVDTVIREVGEQAVFDTGVHGINSELIRVLGRLKYRTSYGQNVLQHSIEVCHLAGLMAAELDADVRLAKRAGLLHDIGKAIDHEVEGSHAPIGADLARRLGESPAVCHAITAHHEGGVEPQTIEAVLVQAADAISAARPGARRETLESYVKRLEKLEAIAESFTGVEKCFAMQAGRELRIMVKPDDIDDVGSFKLARDIAKQIEDELDYPGQIKVTVIRESRAVEYAK